VHTENDVYTNQQPFLPMQYLQTKSRDIFGMARGSDASISFFLFRYDMTMDCNPGVLFQSRDFGIEKCQSRDPGLESRD